MKTKPLIFSLLTCVFSCLTVFAADWESMSPLNAESLVGDNRLIEPTSPIMGKKLVAAIREDNRHPDEIYRSLKAEYPQIIQDLQLSSIAYFTTLKPALENYCKNVFSESDETDIKLVEHAAIPIPVLIPFHNQYIFNIGTMLQTPYKDIRSMAKSVAEDYQKQRFDCLPVKKLEAMEAKLKRYFPKRYDRMVDINHDISSAEGPFPRTQFSINGLTQYVYRELMAFESEKLANLLRLTYDSTVEWLKLIESHPEIRLYSFIEEKGLKAGFLPREIILSISYITRNMPSIDVHYGYDTEEALLLEVYFWKFHPLKKKIASKYVVQTYPNEMKENPGMYHYATAALLSCEIKLHGYSSAMARSMALVSKAGYKVHKLFGEVKGKKLSPRKIIKTAKQQGFATGVAAGRYGGAWGVKLCKKTPKESWHKNAKKVEQEPLTQEDKAVESELAAELDEGDSI